MAKYRTALGKVLDMNILINKNEKTKAVGNMKVNARGDSIDSEGKIIKSVTEKVNENYSKTVGNRSAQPVKKVAKVQEQLPRRQSSSHRTPQKPQTSPKSGVNQMIADELTDTEKELEEHFENDLVVEKIKEQEVNDGK